MGKKVILGLCLLGLASVFADCEPFGWMTRYVTNQIEFANAPVNYVGGRRGVMTNNVSGGVRLLSAGIGTQDISLGLENLLEDPDWSRIKELARGLDHDWRKCYKFVYDNIAFAPYYGILRGPERTLLDREGNDADQAFLLLALLQASGYDSATVVYEPVVKSGNTFSRGFHMPLENYDRHHPYNARDWLDVQHVGEVADSILNGVANTLFSAGRQVEYSELGGVTIIVTDHFWVNLTIDGVSYDLDPSFKPVHIPG